MKIYEIGTGYTPIPAQMGAATEIVVEELTKAFLKRNIPVRILDIKAENRCPNELPIEQVWVPKCFSGTDVKLGIMHKLKRVAYSVCLAGKLRSILKSSEEKIVLHFHNQYNLFFFYKLVPASLRKNAVIAYTNHSYIWHNPWEQIKETIYKRYFQEIYCIEHADYVFVLNTQTRDTLTEHFNINPGKIHLIGNGVNTDTYNTLNDQEKNRSRFEWKVSDKKVFIQVGSVCDRKNQLGALQLLLPLMQQHEDIVFCYAGGIIDAAYQASIEQFAAEHNLANRVQYVGELQPGKQLNQFYNLAEAMVFPSKAEGFSLVILESMSAGTPVLIGKNLQFSLSDHCISYEDGKFVQIVTDQILCEEQQRKLSAQARQTVLETFSWDKIAQDYVAAWQNKKSS